jgi:hypothetical protein
MTLKEKFKEILTAFWIDNWEDESIKLADEFAIGFTEWFWINKDKFYKGERDYYLEFKELLEIYKIEKGL